MASPPAAYSPAGSPPYPGHASLPSKKRPSGAADLAPNPSLVKRRKASIMSITSATSAHPLRQTSFPPEENATYSPSHQRSPSVDTMSMVSASQSQAAAPVKKKRGRKSKAERAREAADEAARLEGEGTPSVVGGRAGTVVSKDGGEDKDDDDGEPEEMAAKSQERTKEQDEQDRRMIAMLKNRMDPIQFNRYEVYHRAVLPLSAVRRHVNQVTSQSCPATVHQVMQTASKLFLGDIVEEARKIQQEWILAGEEQVEESDPASQKIKQEGGDNENAMAQYFRRAPLRPEHLQEAFRRWKIANGNGGSMGSMLVWNQQTHNGTERFAPKAGGRRLFK